MHVRQNILTVILAAGIASGLAAPADAQYTGPSGVKAGPSVSEILAKPVDEQPVRLQGKLLNKISHEKYTFSDGTGEIVAEIDDKDFPGQVDENTRIEIVGEVDTGRTRPPEIEVDTVRKLP